MKLKSTLIATALALLSGAGLAGTAHASSKAIGGAYTSGTQSGTSSETSDGTSRGRSVGVTRTVPLHAVIANVLMQHPELEAHLRTDAHPGYFERAGAPQPDSFSMARGERAIRAAMDLFLDIGNALCLESSVADVVADKSYANMRAVNEAVSATLRRLGTGAVPAAPVCNAFVGDWVHTPADPQASRVVEVSMYGGSDVNPRNAWINTSKNGKGTYMMDPSPEGFLLKNNGMVMYGAGNILGERIEIAISGTSSSDHASRKTKSRGTSSSTSAVSAK